MATILKMRRSLKERERKNWVVTRKKGKEILLGEMFSHSTNCVGLFEMIEEAKLSEEK